MGDDARSRICVVPLNSLTLRYLDVLCNELAASLGRLSSIL